MTFEEFKKICLKHYEEIVNAFCESAFSYNIIFPKNEIEYTYYFQNNNEYLFIINGETYHNNLSGNINLVIRLDIETNSIKAYFDYSYDYFDGDCNGFDFTSEYELNEHFWNDLINEISSVMY